jgi:hypothetical protein
LFSISRKSSSLSFSSCGERGEVLDFVSIDFSTGKNRSKNVLGFIRFAIADISKLHWADNMGFARAQREKPVVISHGLSHVISPGTARRAAGR